MRRRFNNNYKQGNSSGFQSKRSKAIFWTEEDLLKTINYNKKTVQQTVEEEYITTNQFEDFDIHSKIKGNIRYKKYIKPTPIQDQAIPHIIKGHDLIGIANTGTGKTAAFLVPLINKAFLDSTQKILIIVPTRELAEQINDEFKQLSYGMKMYSALLIGGSSMNNQISDLNRNPQFIVGTPGRIRDLINRNILELNRFNNVVLDETDRMVDIGFISEIKLFISLLPKKRQSLFFSATVPPKVQAILNAFVTDPVVINVKKKESLNNIHQDIVAVKVSERKIDTLLALLRKENFSKVIIFGNTKHGVQRVSDELNRKGLKSDAIHGNKKQYQRRSILNKFKKDEIHILLATDVAARGLDICDVSHVINYELPNSYEDYIHRIGRTGRAEKTGVALTFVTA